MITLISLLLLIAFCLFVQYIFYSYYLYPMKIYQDYVKKFRGKGFKVLQIPFQFLKTPINFIYERDRLKGDALKIVKQEYSKYDVIISNVLGKIMVQFVHPDLLKSLFSNQMNYTYPKAYQLIDIVIYGMGKGLVFSEGDSWKKKRKSLNKLFTFQLVKGLVPQIEGLCDLAFQEIEQQKSCLSSEQYQFKIIDLSSEVTSNLMVLSFLGGKEINKIRLNDKPIWKFYTKLMNSSLNISREKLINLFGQNYFKLKLYAHHQQVDQQIQIFKKWGKHYVSERCKETKEKLKNGEQIKQPKNIIQALILKQQSDGEEINQTQVFEEFCTFFFAGTDTTANFVQMMLYFIATNPQVQSKLREQIEKYLQDDEYSFENLKKFTYLDNIQKETTRCYGPDGLFIRNVASDHYINGIPIYKGTYVNGWTKANHWNTKYFKDPQIFRPERWDQQATKQIPPHAIGGFGSGPRSCIGKHLALLSSKIIVLKFMKRYSRISPPSSSLRFRSQLVYSPEQFICKMKK